MIRLKSILTQWKSMKSIARNTSAPLAPLRGEGLGVRGRSAKNKNFVGNRVLHAPLPDPLDRPSPEGRVKPLLLGISIVLSLFTSSQSAIGQTNPYAPMTFDRSGFTQQLPIEVGTNRYTSDPVWSPGGMGSPSSPHADNNLTFNSLLSNPATDSPLNPLALHSGSIGVADVQARRITEESALAPHMSPQSQLVPLQWGDFTPNRHTPLPREPWREIETYYGKSMVEVQRPWVEWWRPFYTGGMYDPGIEVFSDVNLLTPSFIVYGDYRTGVGVHRVGGEHVRSWAHRLNLEMDMRFTGTERFHMFVGPLDHGGQFTRLDFSESPARFETKMDFQPDTAFFEGDLGAITGSLMGTDAPFDLPFTMGLVPLLFQNGIWMEDAILGVAVGSPWRHSNALNWSNYDVTFFAGFNQVTSPAFQNDNNAASVFGSALFVEAYNGYIEMDYAYLHDQDGQERSYHNAAIAYTRRYLGRISNTVRLIGNIGQEGPVVDRSADGGLLIIENSLVSSQPSHFVPYWNLFVGSGRPQSVARAANAGGILKNVGINFETDALTGYPTLTPTGANSYGGAVGFNLLSADFYRQWMVEFAALDSFGNPAISNIAGPQYALGTRYQHAINNRCLWRIDVMNGWFDNAPNIQGSRVEFRWKF